MPSEIDCEVEWIELSQDRSNDHLFMNTVIKARKSLDKLGYCQLLNNTLIHVVRSFITGLCL
jgi:hypothetical protein